MALVSFGGGSDPSGLLASLNRQYLQDIDALAERATRRADERSDATDREIFDQWQNGLITDQAWLDYISKRVQETVGEPEEHQKWVETQREYEDSISDNKMEFAYENGQATIAQVIDYYRARLAGMKPDSQAYREISQRLNQYVDKQLGDDIQSGAQDITDRIVMGQASLGDLISFYATRLGGLRPNSSLHEKIRQEIRDLQSQQIREGAQGFSTGGGGGGSRSSGGGRGGGGNWGTTSEQYEAATSSGLVPKSSQLSAALMERDRTGVSRAAREFGGTLPGMDEQDSDDYIQGARAHAKWMMERFADEDADSIITDPQTGMDWENTPENMRQWAYEYIDLSEMRARGQETGRYVDHSNASGARSDIGEAITASQRVNAIPVQEGADRLNAEYRRQLSIAENSGSPDAVLRVNNMFGREFETLGRNAILTSPRTARPSGARPLEGEERPIRRPTLKNPIARVPEAIAEELIARGQLLRAYARGTPDEIFQAQTNYRALADHDEELADADFDIWDDLNEGINIEGRSPAVVSMVARRMKDGLEDRTFVRVYDPANGGNGISIVPMARTATFDPVSGGFRGTPNPMDSTFDASNGDRWEKIYTDDRNGNPVETWVISRKEALPLQTFVAGRNFLDRNRNVVPQGTPLTASMIGQMSDSELQRRIQNGSISLDSAGEVRTYTYRQGNTFIKNYWNEDLHAWTDVPYSRVGLTLKSVGGTLAVVLNDDHTLGGTLRPFAHVRGRPTNYHGTNPAKFQEMIDSGEIEIEHWGYFVDHLGAVKLDRENDHRHIWYDEEYQSRRNTLSFRGGTQPIDPEYREIRLKREQARLMQQREEQDERDRQGRDPVNDPGNVFGNIKSMFATLGINEGDPSRSRLPTVTRPNVHELARAAAARSASAEQRELEAARQRASLALPRIALPARTGPLTNPVTLPSVPFFPTTPSRVNTSPVSVKPTYAPVSTAKVGTKTVAAPAPRVYTPPKTSTTRPRIL